MGTLRSSLSAAPWALLVAGIAWVVVLGAVGVAVTRLDAWYYALRKPSWQPPDWLFGPAWTTIFICSALAFVLAWVHPAATPLRHGLLITAYLTNATLNVLWSVLFFRRRRPDWAFREVWVLWLSIIAMQAGVTLDGTWYGWLLVPYVTWVSFATGLNRAIVQLNRPFGVH
jgi:tryptophan-rich sensory protein